MRFDDELARGNLVTSFCPACKSAVWPPSETCPRCLGAATWVPFPARGMITEFSQKDGDYFCLAEFGNIGIIGRMAPPHVPRAGMRVRAEAAIRGSRRGFELFPAD